MQGTTRCFLYKHVKMYLHSFSTKTDKDAVCNNRQGKKTNLSKQFYRSIFSAALRRLSNMLEVTKTFSSKI